MNMNKHYPGPAGAGQVRIIGGQWRGRKLPVPVSAGLRPTTDRVRETLFNWLAPEMAQARCLDCFAGSGALGIEALSRYAGHVTLLELDPAVARQLSANLQTLKTTQGHVVQGNTLQWLNTPGEPYDIVFVDPPFRKGLLSETLTLLENKGWLSGEALIYIECETEHAPPEVPASWRLYREKVAGQVAYRLYHRSVPDRQGE